MTEPHTRRVLVVDDEVDFVETLEDLLGSRGFEVVVAHGAEQALARVVSHSPQLALVDIRLGRSSGIDLLSSLRAAAPSLVFVMMTAYADVETAVQALTEGAYHYLHKPIDPRDLLATLERGFEKLELAEQKATAETALRERNAQLAELNARLEQVVRSARSLASCTRLEDLNRRLLDEAACVMAAEGGSLFFHKGDALERVASLDRDHVPARIPLPLAPDSAFGRALATKSPLVVPEIASSRELRGSGWSGYRDGSLLVLPILREAEVAALLSLHNRSGPPFTEQDRELGQVMVSLSGEILKTQQAAAAVRASEERYRLLADNVLDVIFTLDRELQVSYVSPSVTRLTGCAAATVLERGLGALLTPRSLAATRPALERLLRQGDAGQDAAITLDVELQREGEPGRAEVTVSLVSGTDGPSLLAVARDLSERQRAQEEIARLAEVLEQTADDVMITDAAGVILYVNPAFERLLGFSREEAVGRTPRLLRSGVHDQAFYAELWRTISAGGTWRGRITNRCKDGKHVLEEGAISPIRDASGQIVGYVSTKHDVTLQAALETRLLQTQKLESVGRLAGGIAHDFNNILIAIVGFVELLQRSELTQKQQRYVQGIGEAAWRAADLTKQILTFSRQGSLERKPLEIEPVVREALELMRAALPPNIEIHEPAHCDALVMANATQLHQVVVNLCTNAGFAMRERGGRLEVSVQDLAVTASAHEICPPLVPGRHVCVQVRDTGCGMPPEVQARIFEPFYTTRSQGEGSGMGLAVVHGIVEDHGGAITVHSAPGAGATFRVYLPIVSVAAAPAPAAGGQAKPGGERVLFVDGDPAQVELARERLGSLGYRLVGAASGSEALARVRADPTAFDVVVSNSPTAGGAGERLAHELARVRADLPVVLCTESDERAAELRARDPGRREALTKPYSLVELSAAIRRALAARGF